MYKRRSYTIGGNKNELTINSRMLNVCNPIGSEGSKLEDEFLFLIFAASSVT